MKNKNTCCELPGVFCLQEIKFCNYRGQEIYMLKDYVVFDLETTGLSPEKDTMIEIGALKVIQGKVADRFSSSLIPIRN